MDVESQVRTKIENNIVIFGSAESTKKDIAEKKEDDLAG